MNIKDRVVFITGGSKGIGRATAIKFSRQGAKIVLCGRTASDVLAAEKMILDEGGEVLALVGDVTRIEDCQSMVKATIDRYHRLDILINNAGKSMRGLFEHTSLDVCHQIIAINFSGSVNMTHVALPYLKAQRGSLVFISSLSGLKGLPMIAPYSSAKMALTGFSESLRAEISHKDLHIGIIYVGFTENDEGKTILDSQGNAIAIQRQKNFSTQDQVAKAILTNVQYRRKVQVLTPLGHLMSFFYRFFPKLSSRLIEKYAMKSKMYR